MKNGICACIVVANEEDLIGRCLESLNGVVDQIVVVHDGPCYDRTLAICGLYTDRVFVRPFVGIAEPHRVFAMEQATQEWVLWIDADEFLTDELRASLGQLVRRDDVDMYCFLWPYTDGVRDLTEGLDHPYRSCLVRRSRACFFAVPQEPLRSTGRIEKVPLVVRHRPRYDNYTWERFLRKWQPRNQITASWVWRPPAEIPCFGDIGEEEKAALLNRYRRHPLLMGVWMMLATLGWQLAKGMWKAGWAGWRIAFLASLNAAAIRWWIFHERPPSAADAVEAEGELQ